MINCNNLTVSFSSRTLFKDVQLNLLSNHRYAITGANGAGKSTFLKLLAGEEEPNAGIIDKPNGIQIGTLKQDHFRYHDQRVIDVVIEGKDQLASAFKEKAQILNATHISDHDSYRLGELEEIIHNFQGYSAESEAEIILKGLGITPEERHGPLNALSGGYKLRILLAQALFKDPHVLLLDEPTNHLDIISIQWLEKFLVENYKGLLIIVSHDKQFITNTATHILDIDYETITCYPGNYAHFIYKKAEAIAQKEHELAHKQQQIDSMQGFIDRFGAKATKAKQAKSRQKMIDKIEIPDIKATSRIKPHFNFIPYQPTGKQVLHIKALTKSFGDKQLFKNVNLTLLRSQKCAIIGPNGIGKSTLLKIILNQLQANEGEFSWNEKVSIGYFAQNFADLLNPEQTLLEWLCQHVQKATESAARKVLGQMLFTSDAVHKRIKVLSGGECARLVFAKLILEQHNVLILDEPTNHLDMEAIDGLIEGLQKFSGTIICVSHNRYFIQQVASTLLVITPKRIEMYLGTYQEYLAKMGHDYLLKLNQAV